VLRDSRVARILRVVGSFRWDHDDENGREKQ
jgi:hypothetical protein